MTDATATWPTTIADKVEEEEQDASKSAPSNEDDKEKEEVEQDQDATGKRTMDETEAATGSGSIAAEEEEVAGAAASIEEGEQVPDSIATDLAKYTARHGQVSEPKRKRRKKREKTAKTPAKSSTATATKQQHPFMPNTSMQTNMKLQMQRNMQMNMNMQRQAMMMNNNNMMAMNNPMAMNMMMNNNMMNMNNPMNMMMNNNMMNPMNLMMNPMATGFPPFPMNVAGNQQQKPTKPENETTSKRKNSLSAESTGTRGSYNIQNLEEAEKSLKESLLEGAAEMLLKAKVENSGRLPGGYMKTLLEDLRKNPILADATRDTVYNALRKIPQDHKDRFMKLHEATIARKQKKKAAETPTKKSPKAKEKGGTNDDDDSSTSSASSPPPAKSRRKEKEDHEAALEWASRQLMEKQQEAKRNGEKVPHGCVKSLVKQAKKKFQLLDDIPPDTIRSRAKRNNPKGRISSPMEEVEPVLVQLCIEANEMGEPLDKNNFLALANSLIKGTPTEEKVKQFKATCKHDGDAELGIRYYQQFMKRHKDAIKAGGAQNLQEQEATTAGLKSPNNNTTADGTKQGQQGLAATGATAIPPSVAAADCQITAVLLAADPQKSDNYVRKFRSMLIENDISDFATLSLATKEDLQGAGVSIGGALNIYNAVQKLMTEGANSAVI